MQRSTRPAFYLKACFAFFSVLLAASTAHSDSFSDWDVTGFGTIGYADVTKYDDIFIKRNIKQRSQVIEDNGFLVDSRLGLQVRKELEPNWDFVGQVLLEHNANPVIEQAITIGFLRYRSPELWDLSFGRFALDTFLLSDHRNVGYSYHWVRPPTETYGWIPFNSYDGIKLGRDFGDFDSSWRIEGFVASTKASANIGYDFDEDSRIDVTARPIFGGNLSWESGDFSARFSVLHLHFTEDTRPNKELKDLVNNSGVGLVWPEAIDIANELGVGETQATYKSIGLSWHPGPLVVETELSDVSSENRGAYDGPRFYFSTGVRIHEFLPHISFSRAWSDRGEFDYDLPPVTGDPATDGLLLGLYRTLEDTGYSLDLDQYTVSVGLRWDFASRKALKAQCDRVTISDNSFGVYATSEPTPRSWEKDTRTWCSATFDWVF